MSPAIVVSLLLPVSRSQRCIPGSEQHRVVEPEPLVGGNALIWGFIVEMMVSV